MPQYLGMFLQYKPEFKHAALQKEKLARKEAADEKKQMEEAEDEAKKEAP